MPTPQFSTLDENATTEQIKDYLVGLMRYLNYLLSSLDTLNISRLDAKVIVAHTITADMLNVTELSAITANMGTITAGSITTNAEINIGTDATVGNNLYVGNNDPSSDSKIYFNGAYIQSIFGASSLLLGAVGTISLASTSDDIVLTAGQNVGVISQNGTITDIVGSINSLSSSVSSLSSALSGKANSFTGEDTVLIFDGAPMGLGDVTLTFSNGVLTNVTS